MRRIFVAMLIASSAVAGVALFTFKYAAGYSYLLNDPAACKNCHIMNDQYESWLRNGHSKVATCNDCHTPRGFIEKYISKAENGYYHSKGFTLNNFHEPIKITPKNAAIVQKNCTTCHADIDHDLNNQHHQEKRVNCVHCHRQVGHGARY